MASGCGGEHESEQKAEDECRAKVDHVRHLNVVVLGSLNDVDVVLREGEWRDLMCRKSGLMAL